MRSGTRAGLLVRPLVIAVLPLAVANCSSDGRQNDGNTGGAGPGAAGGNAGATAAGGAATGGSPGQNGGAPNGAGGAATGGTNGGGASSGGTPGAGGSTASNGGTAGGGAAGGGMNSGGASAGAGGSATGGSSSGGAGGMATGAFTLTSPDHMDGAKFAAEFTCALAGFNGSIMPELHWTAGPAGTKSYAITFIDVTLAKGMPPNMNGYHWAIVNIPTSTMSLPKGFKNAASIQASQTGNFLGPCPNIAGSGHTDTYEFTIYALASETVSLSPMSGTTAVKNVADALELSHLASTKLTGTSDAKPP